MVDITNRASVGFNPANRSINQRNMFERVQLMRAVYGGTETMRQMGRTFLKQYRHEENDRYIERLQATYALNKLKEAVTSASAKPFMTLLTASVSDDDELLQTILGDIDQNGRNFHIFSHEFFNEAVLCGVAYILVDVPSHVAAASLGEQRNTSIKPFFRLIKSDDMLSVVQAEVDGVMQITHARFLTSRVDFDPETFVEVIYDQVWALDTNRIRVYERKRNDLVAPTLLPQIGLGASVIPATPFPQQYTQIAMGGDTWHLVRDEEKPDSPIPLVKMVAGDEEAPGYVKPCFYDLAYKQIEHFQSTSEQRNILTASRFPMLAVSGAKADIEGEDGTGFEIGPWAVLATADAQAKWYYVEPKGTAFEAGRKDIEALELQMDMLSLNPTVSTHRQYISQNERNLEENRVNTVIHDFAVSCEKALERAIGFLGDFVGRNWSSANVDMNYNYSGTDERSKFVQTVISAHKFGVLSREATLDELRRYDMLRPDFDIAAELAREAPISTSGNGTEEQAATGNNRLI